MPTKYQWILLKTSGAVSDNENYTVSLKKGWASIKGSLVIFLHSNPNEGQVAEEI